MPRQKALLMRCHGYTHLLGEPARDGWSVQLAGVLPSGSRTVNTQDELCESRDSSFFLNGISGQPKKHDLFVVKLLKKDVSDDTNAPGNKH
eukprot:m.1122012 g.1122012  ORF g.1122012 m.1122012 type:complete len:91 (+) comp24401_c1_seq1:1049-1321(+)